MDLIKDGAVVCPDCGNASTVNPNEVIDESNDPEWGSDKYGRVTRLGFWCGECLTIFGLRFVQRHSTVVVESVRPGKMTFVPSIFD